MIFLGGLYAAIGSMLGASITYWVARLGGRPLVDRLARWVRIDSAHIDRAENQFHRWGAGLVLVGRVMPGVRTLVNIPAGLARMPFPTFFVATFIGAYVWCTLLIGAGYVLGHEWALISHYLKQYFPYLLAGGFAVIAVYVLFTRRRLVPALCLSALTMNRMAIPSRYFSIFGKEIPMSNQQHSVSRFPFFENSGSQSLPPEPAARLSSSGSRRSLPLQQISLA